MRKGLLLATGLILLLAIPLALLLQNWVRDVFLVEFWRLLWGARILFESLPQEPIWVLLLVSLVVIAVRSLRTRRKPAERAVEREVMYAGQVQMLARWIERASQGEYFKWSLGQRLGELTWEVMAHREHTTPEQLKQRMKAGTLGLPPVIQMYLQATEPPGFAGPTGFLSRILYRFRARASSLSFDPALEQVVEFLEAQLESGSHPVTGLQSEPEHPLEEPYGSRNQ